MSEITPPLGSFMPVGFAECGYDYDNSPCGRPAAWHIFWNRFEDHSFACDEHAASARSFAEYDRHPLGTSCPMIGGVDIEVRWSWVEPPGGCFWRVGEETLAATARRDEPIGIGA